MSECVIKGDFYGYSDPNDNSDTESSCSINGNLNNSNLPNLPDDFKATCSSSYYNNLQKDTLKKINNTVRVPSSLYMMNIASLNATNKYAYSGSRKNNLTNLNLILNGNFDQPQLNDNSYEYISSTTTVPYWTFNDGVIINNSSAWSYPMPYPNGNQALSIQSNDSYTGSVNQNINLTEKGTYTLSFYACGRPNYESNPLSFSLIKDNTGAEIVYNVTPTIGEWIKYTHDYSITETGHYVFYILGTPSTADIGTAIQDISLTLTASSSTFDSRFNYWNNLSDRKEKHKQQVVVPTRGNSLKRSVTSLRPGALSPGGQGVDVKHGSYDRYLNKLKGNKIFRSVNSNSERLIIDCKCEKI